MESASWDGEETLDYLSKVSESHLTHDWQLTSHYVHCPNMANPLPSSGPNRLKKTEGNYLSIIQVFDPGWNAAQRWVELVLSLETAHECTLTGIQRKIIKQINCDIYRSCYLKWHTALRLHTFPQGVALMGTEHLTLMNSFTIMLSPKSVSSCDSRISGDSTTLRSHNQSRDNIKDWNQTQWWHFWNG